MESRVRHRSIHAATRRISDFSRFHMSGWDNMEVGSNAELVEGADELMVNRLESDRHEMANMANIQGEFEGQVREHSGQQAGGASQGSSPVRVQQGQSSDSTVSNPDVGGLDMGTESWRAKKVELAVKHQKAKEREKALKAQISAQRERIRLEVQEKENHRLEMDILHREQERVLMDREQERQDVLLAEKTKWEEQAKDLDHHWRLENEGRINGETETFTA